MATAKKVPIEQKKVPIEQYKIVLELSEEEAIVLKDMVGNVLGGGKIRNITNNIYYSLGCCGINDLDGNLFTDEFRIKEEN
jgi:hypothetical protein